MQVNQKLRGRNVLQGQFPPRPIPYQPIHPPHPKQLKAKYASRSIQRRRQSERGFFSSLLVSAVTMFFPILAAVCVPLPAFAANYVKVCVNKEIGTYAFGESPSGCDAEKFGDVSRIHYIYNSLVYSRLQGREDAHHRKEYVTNVHALIRDMAATYIRRREPGIKDADVQVFTRAALAVATQESYLSHYRWGLDSRLKLMTGDSVDSHGIMQINQKYHASRDQDNSFDLVGNIMYGIEQYYLGWKRAGELTCVNGPVPDKKNKVRGFSADLIRENRVRAAYSSYNGGASAICRFRNPKHPWAKNDTGWFEKYADRPWLSYVLDERAKPTINYSCLLDGDELCAMAEENRGAYLINRPLVFEDGSTCISGDGKTMECAEDLRSFSCLFETTHGAHVLEPLKFSGKHKLPMVVKRHQNRDTICAGAAPGLALTGEFIKIKKVSRIRADIGGTPIGSVRPGQAFQVLDYEIQLGTKTERYFKIRLDALTTGYIYGGTNEDYRQWAEKLPGPIKGTPLLIPRTGSTIEIARRGGITMRDGIGSGSKPLIQIPAKTQLAVVRAITQGAANEVYLDVEFGGKSGIVYAGRTYPELTIGEWVKVLR